jgi:hypothetical protein
MHCDKPVSVGVPVGLFLHHFEQMVGTSPEALQLCRLSKLLGFGGSCMWRF